MKRDTSLDALKFAMIYLVVLVHLGFKDFGMGVARMVDAFHMPVFVFLSGYFTSQNTDKAKQVRWFKHTLLLYLVAQFAHVLLGLALRWFQAPLDGATFQAGPWCSWKTPVYPQFALWYLVCLVYWRLAAWRFFRKANDVLLICGSLALALASGFVPVDRAWSFQRAFAFCPYFFLGMVFGNGVGWRPWAKCLSFGRPLFVREGCLRRVACRRTCPRSITQLGMILLAAPSRRVWARYYACPFSGCPGSARPSGWRPSGCTRFGFTLATPTWSASATRCFRPWESNSI